MSRTIDERIVEMRFDNRQFEQNVQTSLSTLDKLKRGLDLDNAAKSLDGLGDAAKRCDMSVLGKSVETVQAKFSAFQVVAMTTLSNITNSAANTGKRLVSALTIDPIKTGFQEYETQIGAVQTILANTQHEGTNLQQVNRALDELNTYADKTIYNFTEMTRNIGTFTAAGVNLRTSVDSIKGIANLAAISGSTSQQASTAMYQLSQALAAGKVSLMDWNSVVNAGMGGKVFQDALVRTSELLGTGAQNAINMYGSFRESLTRGEWLTTEVLTETLKQFAGGVQQPPVALTDDRCIIPAECLKRAGINLKIGVSGIKDGVQKDTVWCLASKIMYALDPTQLMPPTHIDGDVKAQILEVIRENTATDAEVQEVLDNAFQSSWIPPENPEAPDNTATNEEVEDILDDVFGEEP